MPATETLTSRQRVIKALNHEPVDRMPIDLGAHYSTGISAFAYWNLRERLGLDTSNITVVDMTQFLARVDEDVLRRFHCDCMLLRPGWPSTRRWNPRGKYCFNIPGAAEPELGADGEWIVARGGQRMRMPEGGFFFDGGWPCLDSRPSEEIFASEVREAERIFKETDYATLYIGFGAYFSDNPDWLCRMLTDPEEIMAENEAALQRDLARARKVIDQLGKYVQAICLNSDLGTQSAPFCRPSVYADLCAPYIKRLCAFIHENSDCKTWLHCCGSIKPMIPILIDSGIDVINPVQISADNMEPEALKREFGDKLVFWGGGCNTQTVLGVRTPAEVRENVRQLIHAFAPRSGFVFNQVHNIMGNVQPENIIAMLDTAYEEAFAVAAK